MILTILAITLAVTTMSRLGLSLIRHIGYSKDRKHHSHAIKHVCFLVLMLAFAVISYLHLFEHPGEVEEDIWIFSMLWIIISFFLIPHLEDEFAKTPKYHVFQAVEDVKGAVKKAKTKVVKKKKKA